MAFLQVYFNGQLKFTVALNQVETRIGRAADNDIVIDNKGVSGHHAIIVRDTDSFYIIDNKSTNGVFVNGLSISQAPLSYGDEITIFKHKLKFVAVDLAAKDEQLVHHNSADDDVTVFVKSSDVISIMSQQQKTKQESYLLQTSGDNKGKRWFLTVQNFEIGKSKTCHLCAGGWFAPQLSAVVSRQSDGYYLLPKKGSKVYLNQLLIKDLTKLKNGDNLQIQNLYLTFYQSS